MCDTAVERLADALSGSMRGHRRRMRVAEDALGELLADTNACRDLLAMLGAGAQLDALRQIRDGQTPCSDCGEPHELQTTQTMEGDLVQSWRDPVDGHVYRALPAAEVAATALCDGVSPAEHDPG